MPQPRIRLTVRKEISQFPVYVYNDDRGMIHVATHNGTLIGASSIGIQDEMQMRFTLERAASNDHAAQLLQTLIGTSHHVRAFVA